MSSRGDQPCDRQRHGLCGPCQDGWCGQSNPIWHPRLRLAPFAYRDSRESDTEQVCRNLHVMTKTPQAFALVVQRKRIEDDDNSQLDIFNNSDDETVARERYVYRVIATNLDESTDSEVVHWYNQRGETSENKLKELSSEIALWGLWCQCSMVHVKF